jgi:hypothetical protein
LHTPSLPCAYTFARVCVICARACVRGLAVFDAVSNAPIPSWIQTTHVKKDIQASPHMYGEGTICLGWQIMFKQSSDRLYKKNISCFEVQAALVAEWQRVEVVRSLKAIGILRSRVSGALLFLFRCVEC